MAPEAAPRMVAGRYLLHEEFAAGGMATVHFGFLCGPEGFARTVAIKRMRPHIADDPRVAATFLDEARLAARVRHANVVQTLDVVAENGEVLLVMEYVPGESLASLLRAACKRDEPLPVGVVSAIFSGFLHGLHAAHVARDAHGNALGLVHRDVCPQNVLVGADGTARILDFGIAKAEGLARTTREGEVKGKLGYMSPEQLAGTADRASDVYSAGVCLWETLTRRRLFDGDTPSTIIAKIIAGAAPPPSAYASVSTELDAIVMRALHREPARRFATAEEMARAIEAAQHPAAPSAVADCLTGLTGASLGERASRLSRIEHAAPLSNPTLRSSSSPPAPAGRLGWLGGAGALACMLGALVLVRSRACGEASGDIAHAARSAPAQPPAAVTAIAVDPDASPAALPLEIATPDASPPDHATRPVTAATAARSAPAAKLDCTPPYTVDADGVRRYKKACFR